MASSINLNKLRDEIDNRKKEKNISPTSNNSNIGTRGTSPRHAFLNGLLESISTGRETTASALIKTVENKVAEKNGETPKISAPRNIPVEQAPRHIPQRINEVEMSPERDEQLFAEFDKRRNKTLAESIASYSHTPMVGAPMYNQQPMQPTNINEGYLTENVMKIVDKYLVENFAPIVEETIKNTIIEMYAVERIKDVLHENKDLIRTVVIETIREIQAKSKAKS